MISDHLSKRIWNFVLHGAKRNDSETEHITCFICISVVDKFSVERPTQGCFFRIILPLLCQLWCLICKFYKFIVPIFIGLCQLCPYCLIACISEQYKWMDMFGVMNNFSYLTVSFSITGASSASGFSFNFAYYLVHWCTNSKIRLEPQKSTVVPRSPLL